MSISSNPIVAVNMGDPTGIGPEIVVKAAAVEEVYQHARPLVIGDFRVMEQAKGFAGVQVELRRIESVSEARFQYGVLEVLDLANVELSELKIGQVQAMGGRAFVEASKKGVELALAGEVHGVLVGPHNKAAMYAAGKPFDGPGLLAHLTGVEIGKIAFMLCVGPMRVIGVTHHASLRKALDQITRERVLWTIQKAYEGARILGIEKPRIAVAGINPHAGEEGIFGSEEIEIVTPAIQDARALGIDVEGPFPADGIFVGAEEGPYDCYIAMYHDQGHLPIKVLGKRRVAALMVGSPIVYGTVGHGTAFEVAGKGIADPASVVEGLKLIAQAGRSRMK
ncbi:MAG: PdxA family dehydrogenase [Chloroflexota bacterium]|jgi:4-hydroxythreonine-4-phosphate dehydrogenase